MRRNVMKTRKGVLNKLKEREIIANLLNIQINLKNLNKK